MSIICSLLTEVDTSQGEYYLPTCPHLPLPLHAFADNTRGTIKPSEFIYKKLCIYSYMVIQLPSKFCPCDVIHLSRLFSTAQNSFWTHWFWCLLVLLPFFVHLFHNSKMFPFEDIFSTRETNKKIAQGELGWIGRVGHGGHVIFGQKLLNTQCSVGRCTRKSPIMEWANMVKESSKEIHWSWTQPLTTTPAGTLIWMGS